MDFCLFASATSWIRWARVGQKAYRVVVGLINLLMDREPTDPISNDDFAVHHLPISFIKREQQVCAPLLGAV